MFSVSIARMKAMTGTLLPATALNISAILIAEISTSSPNLGFLAGELVDPLSISLIY